MNSLVHCSLGSMDRDLLSVATVLFLARCAASYSERKEESKRKWDTVTQLAMSPLCVGRKEANFSHSLFSGPLVCGAVRQTRWETSHHPLSLHL